MSFRDGIMRFIPQDQIINVSKKKDVPDVVIECDHIALYEPRSINKGTYRSLKYFISSALVAGLPKMQKLGEMGAQKNVVLIEDNKKEEKRKTLIDITEEEHATQTQEMTDMLTLALEAGNQEDTLNLFVSTFKKALIQYDQKPLAKLNGDTPMNAGIWDAMTAEDQERMAVGYCSFFGIGSLGKMMSSSKSAPEQLTEVKIL